MYPNNLTQSLRQPEQSWDKARCNCVNKFSTVLTFICLTDKSEMWILVPYILSQINKERIWIFGSLRSPVSTFLSRINDLTLENFIMCINESTIFNSAELLLVNLIDLWANMTIIQMYSVDLIFFYQFKKFIQQQIPSFFLSVVKNGSFFIVHSPALTSIKIIFTAFFINCHKFEMLVFFAHS